MKKISNKELTKKIYNKPFEFKMPPRVSMSYSKDPKHLGFSLARYKFVAKMFEGFKNVLEVGAGDGFKSFVVKQSVQNLTLSDNEDNGKYFFEKNYKNKNHKYLIHDFTKYKLKKKYDGIYLLDVLEHIPKKKESFFLKNIIFSLNKNAVLIIGIPSIEFQRYASKLSRKSHVNCKSKKELKKFLLKYFNNVFAFSMNDEIIHTGFDSLSSYLLCICSNKKAATHNNN